MAQTPLRTDSTASYITAGGIHVSRCERVVSAATERATLLRALDSRRGMLLASNYEYPGRYKRYDYGFVDPALVIEAGALSRRLRVRALTRRGELLLEPCYAALVACDALEDVCRQADAIHARVREPQQGFAEEARTRAPSALSAVRALCAVFASPADDLLGFYGAFGFDLIFQFETLLPRLSRRCDQRDLVLYLPDRLLVIDQPREHARMLDYEFDVGSSSTRTLTREPVIALGAREQDALPPRDHAPGEFARLVERARRAFACGDLFEVTPSQLFCLPNPPLASRVFEVLSASNPAPYGYSANLGDGEHLIGASPEMYVRVAGRRVSSCPIAGTIARGHDAIADAAQIHKLLCSSKDEAELTMCTDVDRNDKARICEPGSVRVIGRRQIELYSRLIHTVDHVEGRLRSGFDAIDAFLTHMWAVTVTGAPKQAALQFIEDHERSPRGYYAGAIGALRFDGSMDTGLVLRTIVHTGGAASVRAGATLHFDSDPAAEEQETELKACALLEALQMAAAPPEQPQVTFARSDARASAAHTSAPLRVLLIDHRDSFVHTLADYLRQAGCHVTTQRFDRALSELPDVQPGLVVLSPGPSRPRDFGMHGTLTALSGMGIPVFGVCLGLQGMVEYCGGRLLQLETPLHGKASDIHCVHSPLFQGLPQTLRVGRYHSLYARADELPAELQLLALAVQDGSCMALSHNRLPWLAVQFHPESILSAESAHGLALIANVVGWARGYRRQVAADVVTANKAAADVSNR